MKKFLLFITMCVSTQLLVAQSANTTKTNGPKIEFATEILDYGTIENGSDGEREFKFTNKGNEALIISTCRGSCQCTVPKCPTEPIMPGQTGTIKVKYNTSNTGAFTKQITVESNDPNGIKILKIQGNVNAPATTPATTPVAPH